MIACRVFKDKNIALFGLGDSGLATAQALMEGGAHVIAFDDNLQACRRAREAGIVTKDLRSFDWAQVSALILAPGVPLTHPAPHWSVKLAQAHAVEVIGDMELFSRQRAAAMARDNLSEADCPLIAITGTNGKSTTTALIFHILRSCGCDVAMGGNIGKPILELEPCRKGQFYVIECSSYQIDLAPSFAPTIGILLNLTPDHIDRHGTFEHYAAVKRRLVAAAQIALVALDDVPCRALAADLEKTGKKPVGISSYGGGINADWFAKGTELYRRKCTERQCATELAVSLDNMTSLRGRHNGQNVLAALAACTILGFGKEQVQAALASFKGLPHRMEEVGRQGNILFVNDSKATNAQACAPALASFDAIYWIAGGIAKQGGIETLKPFFSKICHAYLIGEATMDFQITIGSAAPVSSCGTLAQAVGLAAEDAMRDAQHDRQTRERVVLLSPACASFDQFSSYAARGDAFRQLVNNLLIG